MGNQTIFKKNRLHHSDENKDLSSTQKKLPGNSKKFEVRRGRFWATDLLLLQANLAKLPKGGCMAEVGGWPAQGEGDLLGEFDWEFDSDLLGHP